MMGIKKHTVSFQIIFFILFFLEVLPVWYFTHFPTHDVPAHIYNSYVGLMIVVPPGIF